MNRNIESRFAHLPAANVPRSIFDRSHDVKTSFNCGSLVPFFLDEVLPGDTFDITTSKVVRAQTLLDPIMDNMVLDTFYFFVPARLCWEHWKEFCGENTAGPWAPTNQYLMPSISSPEGGFASGTLADYFGLPVGVSWNASDELAPSALPFRAYALIVNQFFRDENLQDPLLVPLGDANQTGTNDAGISAVANGGQPFIACKLHDYFSSALPQPQKGSPVGIPISIPGFQGGTFPVSTIPYPYDDSNKPETAYPLLVFGTTSADASTPFEVGSASSVESFYVSAAATSVLRKANLTEDHSFIAPANLAAVIPPQSGQTTSELSFTINQFRLAYVLQCYLERLARSGSRYTEQILSLFGVRSPDARLQNPEYLGGNRISLQVTEATNTAQTENDYLGDVGAKSHTADVHSDFIKSFTEHGYILGLMCVRYAHNYSQGVNRMWTRKTFEDFYNPVFANLGEVPIYKAEIYADSSTMDDKSNIFGYQEIWSEYRYKPNLCTGLMRPGIQNSLASWHLGDYYTSEPTLSPEWIVEDKSMVDRVLAVTSEVSDQFWADIFVKCKCTRPMPMYSIPGLEPRL